MNELPSPAAQTNMSDPNSFVPSYSPLLLRSSNLNSWAPSRGGSTSKTWPISWDIPSGTYLGFEGLIRIDNEAFTWLGGDASDEVLMPFVNQTLTTTSTIQTFETDKVNLSVTYLSPIESNDLVRQSFPFSYISLRAESKDQQPHSVQVYLNSRSQWLSYPTDATLALSTHKTDAYVYFQANKTGVEKMSLSNDRPDDATLYMGMPLEEGSSYRLSQGHSRSEFREQGVLGNTGLDGDYPWKTNDEDLLVFALAKDMGTIQAESPASALFALGMVRDPSILYTPTPESLPETRSPCFKTKFSDVETAFVDFLDDFPNAVQRAAELDERIKKLTDSVSSDVYDLVTVAARTVMASIDVTCGFDADDVMFFVNSMNSKHDGSNSRSYSNRVDDLYAAWPAIMTINATYGKYILEPLLHFQNTNTGTPYAIPDLGNTYPKITGGNPRSQAAQALGVEETGNMLLMIWAHARFTGDSTLVTKYYPILQRWADFLLGSELEPYHSQRPPGLSEPVDPMIFNANGEDASQNTNLAIKAALGVKAMAELAWIQGNSTEADKYNLHAVQKYESWISYAFHDRHLSLQYNTSSTWGLMYDMYPDKWLGLNMIPDEVYTAQDEWYQSQLGTKLPPYNSTGPVVKTHWASFTAATMTNTSSRDLLMGAIHTYLKSDNTRMFPSTYIQDARGEPSNETEQVSLVLGSVFASPALGLKVVQESRYTTTPEFPPHGNTYSGGSSVDTSTIVGAVIGGVAALALSLAFWILCRRRRARKAAEKDLNAPVSPFVTTSGNLTAGFHAREKQNNTVLNVGYPGQDLAGETAEHSQGGVVGRMAEHVRREVLEVLFRQDPPPEYQAERSPRDVNP